MLLLSPMGSHEVPPYQGRKGSPAVTVTQMVEKIEKDGPEMRDSPWDEKRCLEVKWRYDIESKK